MMILRCTCFVMLHWAFRWRLSLGRPLRFRWRFISSIIVLATIIPFLTIFPSRPCVTTRHDDLCCCVCANQCVCACVCVFCYVVSTMICLCHCAQIYLNFFKLFTVKDISPTALTFSPKCLSDVHIPTYIACIIWIFSHKTM